MRLTLSFVLMTALLTLISGCSYRVSDISEDVCPAYPKIDAKTPEIHGQIKAFRKISFILDRSVPVSNSVCRFNNADGDNEMKNAIIIHQDDLFKLITDFGDMLSGVEQHNNRVDKHKKEEDNGSN